MKLPQVMDAEDAGIIARGAILFVLLSTLVLASAAVLATSWRVFEAIGGV